MSSFLQAYQRQPKLFIDLPSKGIHYNDTIIQDAQYIQIPVFGMNAMDEIMFKTPDALFTGQATAEVIKSCIPTILDPWNLVGFDIDYVLIAIRIATYGDEMSINSNCTHCSNSTESALSLTKLIQGYETYQTSYSFNIDDLVFNLKPITYKQMTDFSIENYSYDRHMIEIAKSELKQEEKDSQTKDVFLKSNELNLRVAISYIESVSNDSDTENSIEAITEFVTNNDAVFYNKLKTSIYDLSSRWKVPNLDVTCVSDECGKNYTTKIDLDYSNFFGLKFLHSRNLIS